MDNVILSALARGKPVAAKRVQALAEENARLKAELADARTANEMAHNLIKDQEQVIQRQRRVVDLAHKWGAHDTALAEALREVYGDRL